MQPFDPNQDSINHEVNVILLKKIIELLDTKEERQQTLQADEVRAALRNELAAVVKSIKAIPEVDNKDILRELKALQAAVKAIEMKPQVNVEAATVTVPEIKLPVFTVPEITVPEAKITVNVPDFPSIPTPIVNVQAPVVNIPPVDLESLVKELHVSLEKLRTNNKSRPLAVRMTDGAEWIKELQRQHAQTTQFMSDVSYIRDAAGHRINPATEEGLNRIIDALATGLTGEVTVTSGSINTTENAPTFIGDGSKNVTTAGTREALVSIPTSALHVIITAKEDNAGTIWVGGETVSVGRGRPLVALQSEKIEIDDANKIYLDATVSGDGVTFIYVRNDEDTPLEVIDESGGSLFTEDSLPLYYE